jgi:amino acid adenylation domain-containing protein
MQKTTQGFRLSSQQRSLWLLQDRAAEQPYRALCAILIEGELQPRALEKALYDVVQRHEILRTTFQRPQGVKTSFQVVSDNAYPTWQASDLSHLSSAQQDQRIEAYLAEERARRFDFELGPLLRLSIFKLSAHRRIMSFLLPALCADGLTLTNFVHEISAAYETNLNQQEHGLEVMQYVDFAEWQNELREAEDEPAAQGRAFWNELKNSGVSTPALPLERRCEQSAFSPAAVPICLKSGLCSQLKLLARQYEVPFASLLFASWQAVVWRLTGQSDFVISSLTEGRKLDDLKAALGLYDAFLPVRCSTTDVAFGELALAADHALNEVREWSEYFEADSTEDQVAFEFAERPAQFGTSVKFSILKHEVQHAPFKLKLSCIVYGEALTASLQYDAGVFDRETVIRFAGYWQQFLTTQAEAAQTSVSDSSGGAADERTEACPRQIGAVELLSPVERGQLLFDLNRTHAPFSRDKCFHELFEEQVARAPDAAALRFDDLEISYGQLNARANQLAHLLRAREVQANSAVGLSVARGAEMIIGLLGIMKAGAAYVPLNPEHPKDRVAHQLAESRAPLLITNSGTTDPALKFTGETIDLELHRESLAAQPETNPVTTTRPENLVYIIYTSGSTGMAKGVAVQHRNLVNYTEFVLRLMDVKEPLQFATVSTITADLGNTCIFPALASGGCLHILSYEVSMESDLFRAYAGKYPLDVLKIVPSHLQALLLSQPDGKILPAKFLLLGGEAFSWELAERISELNPRCQVFNHYGPTETTVGSLTFKLQGGRDSVASLTVPIGRPIANTGAYVLDNYMQPQPTGVAGELYLGGAGVTAGYLNQPAETAARFVTDPFSADPGARLYRTGDMVRRLSDGNIEFLGRIDNQIKVRGFRVELGEIEAVLSTHRSVRQAVVIGSAGTTSDGAALANVQRLIAYVVFADGKPPAADELRHYLQQQLPDYMIPSVFVSLRSLPLTANGKVDRAALPAPDDARPELQKVFTAPRNDTEKQLAAIWADLLKVDEVGVHDNFFDLGGHSLLATQIVSRMRQIFQLDIPLRSLFESPTVAALAEKIEAARLDDTARLLAELEQLSDDEAERLLRGATGE